MKRIFITLSIILIIASTANSQKSLDSADNIKSKFGVGYGLAIADMDSKVPLKNLFSFHLRFTLKSVTKYLFVEFAANIYPEYVRHEDRFRDVTSKNISFSPLFGKSDDTGKLFLYMGPSIDFNQNELAKMKLGYGVTLRVDYDITKIVTAGLNLKYINFGGLYNSSFLLSNLNLSFTL